MKKFQKSLPFVGSFSFAAVLITLFLAFGNTAPVQANENSLVPCNESLAIDAVKNNTAAQHCVKKARDMYPGRVLKVNVTSTNGCSTTIRGCTYVVTISLAFPCPNPPFCLAGPEILVLQAGVDCLWNVTYVNCFI